jgi:hypothetical protein
LVYTQLPMSVHCHDVVVNSHYVYLLVVSEDFFRNVLVPVD